nr:zinc ribbon domain-containing protein [Acinetobacter terrae]
MKGLWECENCSSVLNRDLNSAKNILALGHKCLAGGISIF